MQVKEHAAEPATAAEEDAQVGASTVEWMRTLPGAAFSMKNRLGVIFGVSAPTLMIRPFHTTYIINFHI